MIPTMFSNIKRLVVSFLNLYLISASIYFSDAGLCKYCLAFLHIRLKYSNIMSPMTKPIEKTTNSTTADHPYKI